MKNILSLESQRILNIASNLILSRELMTHQSLQRKNKSNYETLCQDLQLIEKEYSDLFDLTFENGKFFSKTKSLSTLEEIKKRELKKNLPIQVLLAIYFDPAKELSEYVQVFGESEDTLQNALLQLNDYLAQYRLEIVDHQGLSLISIDGRSIQRILFMTDWLYLLGDYELYFPELDFTYLEDDFFKEMSLPWKLCEYIALAYQIKAFDRMRYDDSLSEEDLLRSFVSRYENKMQQQLDELSHETWKDSFQTPIDLISLGKLLLLMAYWEQVLGQRVDNLYNRYDYFYQHFKKESPDLVREYERFLASLEETLHLTLSEQASELFFILETQIGFQKERRKYQIAVFSDLGFEHAKSLAFVISQHFPRHAVEVYQEDHKFYDFLISTTTEKHVSNCRKQLTVSDYLNASDLKKIYEHLD